MLHSASTRKQDNTMDACDTVTLTEVLLSPAPTMALSEVTDVSSSEEKAAVPKIMNPKSSHD